MHRAGPGFFSFSPQSQIEITITAAVQLGVAAAVVDRKALVLNGEAGPAVGQVPAVDGHTVIQPHPGHVIVRVISPYQHRLGPKPQRDSLGTRGGGVCGPLVAAYHELAGAVQALGQRCSGLRRASGCSG